jgi:hypothetical protein
MVGLIGKIIAVLTLSIIVGAITATTVASPWKFAVLSDINYADGRDIEAYTLEFLVRDIKNQGVDLVIFPGDMIDGSDNIRGYKEQLDSWKAMMKPLYDAGIPIYVVRGNHEAESLMSANSDLSPNEFENHKAEDLWPNEFGNYESENHEAESIWPWPNEFENHEAESIMKPNSDLWLNEFPLLRGLPSPDGGFTYSFVHKNAKFVGFDQFINPQRRMMNSWVTTQINDSTSPLNFAFAHEPFYPNSYVHNGYRSMSDDPNSRDALISALSTRNGTYFTGHEHLYLRANVSDGRGHTVTELIVGTAGHGNYNYVSSVSNYLRAGTQTVDRVYSNSANPYFGYLLVTVYDNNTWMGEFKGFQYTSNIWKTQFPAIQTLDRFSIPPGLVSGAGLSSSGTGTTLSESGLSSGAGLLSSGTGLASSGIGSSLGIASPPGIGYNPCQKEAIEGLRLGLYMGQMYALAKQGLDISDFNTEVDRYNAWVRQNFGDAPNFMMPKIQEGMPGLVSGAGLSSSGTGTASSESRLSSGTGLASPGTESSLGIASPSGMGYNPCQKEAIEGLRSGLHMGQMYALAKQGHDISDFNTEVDRYNAWVQQNFGDAPNLMMPKMQEGMPGYVPIIRRTATKPTHAIDASVNLR